MSKAVTVPASPAKWDRGKWIDANGHQIDGHAPLAQLGVGGTYVQPGGKVARITAIEQQEDSKGRAFTIVTSEVQGG